MDTGVNRLAMVTRHSPYAANANPLHCPKPANNTGNEEFATKMVWNAIIHSLMNRSSAACVYVIETSILL